MREDFRKRAQTDGRTRYHLGVLFLILSSFSFAVMNLCVRMAGDLPTYEKVFFRNLIAFIFAVIVLARKHGTMKMHWNARRGVFMFLRCFVGCIGVVANFYAIDHMVVADAAMLNKLSPFFILIFSIFILNEKVKPFQLFCIILAFIGVLFIVKPGFTGMQIVPAMIGILSGASAGFAYTCVRKLGLYGVPGPWIVLCFSLFSCLAMVPFMAADFVPIPGRSLAILLMAGLGAAGGQFAITAAYTYAPAREISIYDYSQLLFITLLTYFFLGEVPDAISWIGYAIIILGSLLLFIYNNRSYTKMQEQEGNRHEQTD